MIPVPAAGGASIRYVSVFYDQAGAVIAGSPPNVTGGALRYSTAAGGDRRMAVVAVTDAATTSITLAVEGATFNDVQATRTTVSA